MREFFHGWRRELGCVTLVMALVLWWALRWLLSQLHPFQSVDTVELSSPEGRTVVVAGTLIDQMRADLAQGRGVHSAQGRLASDRPLEAVFRVTVDDDADLTSLAHYTDHYVRRRAEHTIGQPVGVALELVLEPPPPPARVT